MAANNKYVQCNLSLEDAMLELKQIKNKKANKYIQCKPAVSNKSISFKVRSRQHYLSVIFRRLTHMKRKNSTARLNHCH